MNITITGRHMEMTDALKSYIEGSLGKVESHFDKVIDADVVLDVQKHRHLAEVNLHANGLRLHGKESSPDMYASVDAVMNKLEKQIKKYKDRINRHQPRTAREARNYHHAIVSANAEDFSLSSEENGNGNGNKHAVVEREKIATKPMSLDEAVLQLNLIEDHPFFVFTNADTSQVNVLYSRGDGTYGLIEPQF